MNCFEFGILVSSLRVDMHWTQPELAERSGISLSAIRNLERGGRKTMFKDDALIKLADVFRLTSMERMEFMFAASGVTEVEKLRKEADTLKKKFDPNAFLKETGEYIARVTVPVLITDAFCDILLVNHNMLEFYGIPAELMHNADTLISGYNTMRYIFDPLSNFPKIFSVDSFEKQALLNIRYFRRRTLRVRSKPYFVKLLKELLDVNKYPSFERCWRKILFEDLDNFSQPLEREYPDNHFSFIMYESLFALTPYGELFMHQILPTTRQTAERIENISKKVGEGYEQFAPFPDKRKL